MEKADILFIIDALRMPPEFVCGNGTVCNATAAVYTAEVVCISMSLFSHDTNFL